MKDPAALLYIDKWIAATQGMQAEAKGWYLDLILHQFDKGFLPNNLDELASICRIRPSEWTKFEHVFNTCLSKKFNTFEDGTLFNDFALEIIKRRKTFKSKRSDAGKISYLKRWLMKKNAAAPLVDFIISDFDFNSLDLKNEQVLEQVFKQKSELFINANVNVNISKDESIVKGGMGEKEKKEEKPKKQPKEIIIPSKEEFLKYCAESLPQWGLDYKRFEFFLTAKYEAWVANGWKDGHNKEIKNWKSKIKIVISYKNQDNATSQPIKQQRSNAIDANRQAIENLRNNAILSYAERNGIEIRSIDGDLQQGN